MENRTGTAMTTLMLYILTLLLLMTRLETASLRMLCVWIQKMQNSEETSALDRLPADKKRSAKPGSSNPGSRKRPSAPLNRSEITAAPKHKTQ